AEAVRVVKLMPKWQPAERGGKPVRSRVNFPVHFKL
ncbi:MAG: energy transducer TonB, partial [Paludibacteraceae bacterium]|nr:energy transducer TonB [Paludibacteraceae bacterium]